MHASHKVFVCYKLRFMLIHGNPRAEQTEPRIRSARFSIGRDETEHRPTLLGRTEIETEHPLAPRDESEQYSISVRSVRSQAWVQLLSHMSNVFEVLVSRASMFSAHSTILSTA